jgi:hypothetical protein
MTGDETWSCQYDPEVKCQSMDCKLQNSPAPKKPQMSTSKIKTMLVSFFDIRGIIHFEFVSEGTTVNLTLYVVLKRPIAAVRHK